MNRQEKLQRLALSDEIARRLKFNKLKTFYPDSGPLRRELYTKHLKFFNDGKTHRERLFMAANRVGKTEGAGGVEVTYHLTGNYPIWWGGKTFNRPITIWAAGNTSKTTRDVIQNKLYGPKENKGTGLIPKDLMISESSKSGVPDAFDTCKIKHKSGGVSTLVFKSYDQGRTAFEGEKIDVVWLDEEPPLDIYTECLLRTADTSGLNKESGLTMLTFTPLNGMSETVLSFLPGGEIEEHYLGSKAITMASWNDVPHLTEETKRELLAAIPPFQRDARTKGIPQLGSGAIYPVAESDILVTDFQIPDHWPKVYGKDVGWNRTAVAWGAWDRDNDIVYIFSEHYRGQAEPSIHAESIKARGLWIPGVIDPASNGRSQHDGHQLIETYRALGLDLESADNSVESGIYKVWQRLSTGRLKVFKSCQNLISEYRLYRRDEKGRIVKTNDHIMDALRYLIVSGLDRAKVKPADQDKKQYYYSGDSGSGWMS